MKSAKPQPKVGAAFESLARSALAHVMLLCSQAHAKFK
jgi:hypothetical protein